METLCVTGLCEGIHRSPVASPHKSQWRGALVFSLICTWTTDWANNRVAGDLRRHRAHYDVNVMYITGHLPPYARGPSTTYRMSAFSSSFPLRWLFCFPRRVQYYENAQGRCVCDLRFPCWKTVFNTSSLLQFTDVTIGNGLVLKSLMRPSLVLIYRHLVPHQMVHLTLCQRHDDVIKWKHFPRCWPFVRGIHPSPVNSPHKGQRRGALRFSLICTWTNNWVICLLNNREAGDLRRHRAHCDVTVME